MRDEILRAYSLIDFMDILQEECAELICACSKYKRCTGHGFKTEANIIDTVDNIVEEIADVSICLEQMKHFFKDYKIDEVIEQKMQKFLKEIEEQKKK